MGRKKAISAIPKKVIPARRVSKKIIAKKATKKAAKKAAPKL